MEVLVGGLQCHESELYAWYQGNTEVLVIDHEMVQFTVNSNNFKSLLELLHLHPWSNL